MGANSGRLERERNTIKKMIRIYCRDNHSTSGELCEECLALFDYASLRLDKCKFGKDKPVCGNCTIHCYKPDMRQKVREVMKYSGPKMIFEHPMDAVKHLVEKRRKMP
ncbi:MAG: nitrous oxide-stimulated promoter family protein [Desulfitobacterium hafniense]|nr:nitrous oxide-stimulated promoter family protein [Desulfitobacterium hafniense]